MTAQICVQIFVVSGVAPPPPSPLKKESHIGKPAIDVDSIDSSMLIKTAADSQAKGKKQGPTPGLLG